MITLLALIEYSSLRVTKTRSTLMDASGVVAGLVLLALVYTYGTGVAAPVAAASVFIFFFLSMSGARDFKDALTDVAARTLGVFYIALPLSYLLVLRPLEGGQWWIMFIFVVIWANDTLAYFTGRAIGRHKLCPRVSPNKTVEGAVGGLAGGAVAALIFTRAAGLDMGFGSVIVISLILGVVGIIGDLAESVLKRAAGAKDSGSMIPGHGGILDRIDSLLFPIPVLYYFLLCQQ